MTKDCDACHTPNRDGAKYCRGCAGKFSGMQIEVADFASTLPDALAMQVPLPERAVHELPRTPRIQAKPKLLDSLALPARIDISLVLLLIVLLLLYGTFAYWHSSRSSVRKPPIPSSLSYLKQSPPAPQEAPANSFSPGTTTIEQANLAEPEQQERGPANTIEIAPRVVRASTAVQVPQQAAPVRHRSGATPQVRRSRIEARATARTAGNMPCDRYNPFGEAVCFGTPPSTGQLTQQAAAWSRWPQIRRLNHE